MAEVLYRLAGRQDMAFLPWSSSIAEAWLRDLEPLTRDASMRLKVPDAALIRGNEVLGETLTQVRSVKLDRPERPKRSEGGFAAGMD